MKSHPKGLFLLFTVEMWERFSYYGMRALLVLFLTASLLEGGLGFSDRSASMLYGVFTGLIYFTPLIGGYIADRYLGQRRAISLGMLLLMAGQLFLAFSYTETMVYTGLVLMIAGNGFFKPCSSILVGDLYPKGDERIDSAYTIFYMGINLGSFFAPILTGWLAVTYGYRYGFFAAACGLLAGFVIYLLLANKYLGKVGVAPQKVNEDKTTPTQPLTSEEKHRMWVIVVLTLFAVAFFAGYEQAGCSMTLFVEKYVDRTIGAIELPTAWFQSINPLLILVLAPAMSVMWTAMGRRNPSIPLKMGLGLVLLGVGFVFMMGAVLDRGGDIDVLPDLSAKASMWFIVMAYFFHTVGELCLSPIGLSMVSRLAPVRLASLLMGVWLASSAVANMLAGYLSSLTSDYGCYELFLGLSLVGVLLGVLLMCLRKPLVKWGHGRL